MLTILTRIHFQLVQHSDSSSQSPSAARDRAELHLPCATPPTAPPQTSGAKTLPGSWCLHAPSATPRFACGNSRAGPLMPADLLPIFLGLSIDSVTPWLVGYPSNDNCLGMVGGYHHLGIHPHPLCFIMFPGCPAPTNLQISRSSASAGD